MRIDFALDKIAHLLAELVVARLEEEGAGIGGKRGVGCGWIHSDVLARVFVEVGVELLQRRREAASNWLFCKRSRAPWTDVTQARGSYSGVHRLEARVELNFAETTDEPMTIASRVLPPSAIKRATHLVRDSRLALATGLIPILSLVFILRLVQWYVLRSQYAVLASGDAGQHAELVKQFKQALPRLWLAVLIWPAGFLIVLTIVAVT
jgi:hypothetical protein